jgi:peptidoglycan/LPS O-acetylase OafA/YrhL
MGGERFAALDGWRGIAACMVALYHCRTYSHISELGVVTNAYLFVDFFFVLSGFVIAAGYGEPLARGFGTWRFMLLRFGRLYPLHIATLAAFVALDLARGQPWPPDAFEALLARVFLLHGTGLFDTQLWNSPSWTIGSEFLAYLVFALAVAVWRERAWRAMAAIALVGAVVIYAGVGTLSAKLGYEMLRCLYGFGAGVLSWHLFRRFREDIPSGTLAEVVALVAVVLLVSTVGTGPWTMLHPVAFCAALLVFAPQRGLASRVLASKPMVFLGAISYSIYMVHLFLAQRMAEVLRWAMEGRSGIVEPFATSKWAGDALVLAYLAIVVGVSALTYRFIETPGRSYARRLAAYSSLPMTRSSE